MFTPSSTFFYRASSNVCGDWTFCWFLCPILKFPFGMQTTTEQIRTEINKCDEVVIHLWAFFVHTRFCNLLAGLHDHRTSHLLCAYPRLVFSPRINGDRCYFFDPWMLHVVKYHPYSDPPFKIANRGDFNVARTCGASEASEFKAKIRWFWICWFCALVRYSDYSPSLS